LSLLIFLLAMGIWVRSYRRGDFVTQFRSGMYREIATCRGRLYIQTGPTSYPDGTSWTVRQPVYVYVQGIPRIDWQLLGVEHISVAILNGVPGRSCSVLVVPLWLFGLFAIPPVLWLTSRRWRRDRVERGFPVELKEAAAQVSD
jgi:hypothetical protein